MNRVERQLTSISSMLTYADYKVLHCPRTCNTVAHKLASTGVNMTSGSSLFWPDVAPEFVISLVAADLIPVSS
jgi:hypothetical protein